jgi:hypothetical protein
MCVKSSISTKSGLNASTRGKHLRRPYRGPEFHHPCAVPAKAHSQHCPPVFMRRPLCRGNKWHLMALNKKQNPRIFFNQILRANTWCTSKSNIDTL